MRLIDADALERKVMEMSDDDLCEDCCYNVVNAIDEAPTIGGWISVEDRLPEEGVTVLTVVEMEDKTRGFTFAYHSKVWKYGLISKYSRIIYWMPLPEIPKDGDANDHSGDRAQDRQD